MSEHPGSITVEDESGKELASIQVDLSTQVREDGEVIVSLTGPRIEDAEYTLFEHGAKDSPWGPEEINEYGTSPLDSIQ